jgi:hypothetical protein
MSMALSPITWKMREQLGSTWLKANVNSNDPYSH